MHNRVVPNLKLRYKLFFLTWNLTPSLDRVAHIGVAHLSNNYFDSRFRQRVEVVSLGLISINIVFYILIVSLYGLCAPLSHSFVNSLFPLVFCVTFLFLFFIVIFIVKYYKICLFRMISS